MVLFFEPMKRLIKTFPKISCHYSYIVVYSKQGKRGPLSTLYNAILPQIVRYCDALIDHSFLQGLSHSFEAVLTTRNILRLLRIIRFESKPKQGMS